MSSSSSLFSVLRCSSRGALILLLLPLGVANAQNVTGTYCWRSFNDSIEVNVRDLVSHPGLPPTYDSLRLYTGDNGGGFCSFAIGRPGPWLSCADFGGNPDVVRYTFDYSFSNLSANGVRVSVDGTDSAHVYSTRRLRNVGTVSRRRTWLPRYLDGPSSKDAGNDGAIHHNFRILSPIDSVSPAIGGAGIVVRQSMKADLVPDGIVTRGAITMCWTLQNADVVAHTVGLSVGVDLYLGDPIDGWCPGYVAPAGYTNSAPIFVSSDGFTSVERDYGVGTPRAIPDYWISWERAPGDTSSSPRTQAVVQGDLRASGLVAPDRFYVLGGNTLGGVTWNLTWAPTNAIGGALTDDAVMMIWDPRTLASGDSLRICTRIGAGLVNADTIPVSVKASASSQRPTRLALAPNAPNPFNPATTLRFTTPTPGRATLAIVNVLGTRVRMLVDADLGPGEHTIFWDGTDDAGAPVGSGVYVATLRTRDGLANRRLLLQK